MAELNNEQPKKVDNAKPETTPKRTPRKTAPKAKTAAPPKQDTPAPAKEKETFSLKDVDDTQYITVRNGFQGVLIYTSKRTGEKFQWESFGDEQDIELRELKNAKNSSKKFFENNWFMFDEDWVLEYLGVKNLYRGALKLDEFDDVFTKDADEIEKIINGMSNGQKRSLAYRARMFIEDGTIDSVKSIKVLEKSLGIELVD